MERRAAILPAAATGLLALFFWLLIGDLGLAIRERSALPAGLELLRVNGASDTLTSVLLSTVPALLSVLLVPFVGYHSDHYRSRHGRRRPFLLVSAPLGAAAMIGLAFSPMLGQATHQLLGAHSPGPQACNLGWFALFWTTFECAAVTSAALFTGLVNDVMPGHLLGRFYACLRVVGLSVGIAFNSWVFALLDHHLFEILLGVGVLFGLPMVLMCWMIREAPTPAAPPGARSHTYLVPRAHVLECFGERRYLWAFAAFMLASVTFSPFNTFYQYYAQAAGISKAALGSMTAYGYGVSMVIAFGVGWLVDRVGAVRVSATVMAAYVAVAASGFIGIEDEASFRLFYLAHLIISGAWWTAAASMPMALFPKAQFVQYNSTKDLMVAGASILVSSLQGPVLDWSGHNYRLTLLSAAVFSLLCVGCLLRTQSSSLSK